ncbi:MAG: hypothetical protein H6757_02035 [Candidatus Omnitrophica bacterium]|nr:hypothetical protein [Candidatus Omnitrophota bacterium]
MKHRNKKKTHQAHRQKVTLAMTALCVSLLYGVPVQADQTLAQNSQTAVSGVGQTVEPNPIQDIQEKQRETTVTENTTLHLLTGEKTFSPAELSYRTRFIRPVVTLIRENCTESGNGRDSTTLCHWVYSDGYQTTLYTVDKIEENRTVTDTTITQEDYSEEWLSKREIHHVIEYASEKIKDSETYDILYEFRDGIQTREVLKYSYYPDSTNKRIKSMSWTKYREVFGNYPRDLDYHAVLVYGPDGSPLKGSANSWENGRKAQNFLEWNHQNGGLSPYERDLWYQWEKWIRSGFLHVYLA